MADDTAPQVEEAPAQIPVEPGASQPAAADSSSPVVVTKSTADEWLGLVFVLLVGGVIVATWVINALGLGKPELEIVTSASPSDTTTQSSWRLSGYILLDGSRMPGAEVWSVASDSRGNRHSPGIVLTDSSGHFLFPPVPRRIGATDTVEVVEARVFAKVRVPSGEGKTKTVTTVRGRDVLRLSSRGQLRWVDFSAQTMVLLWLLPALFLLTIVLALLQARPGGPLLRLQYYGSVLLAFFFTLAMLGSIGLGLRDVNISGAKAEVLTLGFASIYQGTYVATVDSDWLFSLTSPSPGGTPDGLVHGFGAPLWVIFVSILGAAVFTVSIFVTHVKGRIDFMLADDVRDRIEQIVRHQFYILFSPLGAVVVYQLLVAGGAASKQVTVAIAAMAAGIALNPILDRALRSVGDLVRSDTNELSREKSARDSAGARPLPDSAPSPTENT